MNFQRRTALCLAVTTLASALLASPALARGPTRTTPESVGLSTSGVVAIGDWLRQEVAQKKIPGAIILIGRGGKTAYYETIGQRGPKADDPPMRATDIFRIYSMSKPIVSVAAMMLVEDGKLDLDAPLARYISAFAKVQVGVEKNGQLELLAPARPITVRDLMRHTSGLTYGFFGEGLVKKAYRDAAKTLKEDPTTEEYADFIAALPLNYQPGSTWDYSVSTDILGRVVEVASGMKLSAFLKSRLLDPLGMKDTSFYVTEPSRQARVAEPFDEDRVIGVDAYVGNPRIARKIESGGGGMLSTAPDYARFLQMLLSRGQYKGKRFLSEKSVDEMTRDQLGASVQRTALYLPGPDYTFGLGFGVRTRLAAKGKDSQIGEFNWGGAGGTYMWVDPASDMYVVFMMQSPKQRSLYRATLRELVYKAVTKDSLK